MKEIIEAIFALIVVAIVVGLAARLYWLIENKK